MNLSQVSLNSRPGYGGKQISDFREDFDASGCARLAAAAIYTFLLSWDEFIFAYYIVLEGRNYLP